MNGIQKYLLGLLLEIDDICKKHDIDYVICGGGALGIERNKGFLPWDDDIDLFITRANLNKLNKVLESELPEGRIWLTSETNQNYNNPIPRYMDANSTMLFRSWLDQDIPLGHMIEFFVLDPYPNEKAKQEEYNKYLWLYCELQATRFVIGSSTLSKKEIDADMYRSYLKRIEREGRNKVLAEIEREHLTYSEEECDFYCARWGLMPKVVRKEWAQNIIRRPFEGYELPFFKDNIEYLYKTEYGFEWNLIPREGRRATHDTISVLDEPFEERLGEVTALAREGKVRQLQEENKRDNIERLFARLDWQEAIAAQKRDYLQQFVAGLEKSSWAFSYANLAELKSVFKPFFDLQFSQRYNKWGLRVEMREDLLETMIQTLLFSNRIAPCQLLLGLYPDFSSYDKYWDISESIRRMRNAKYAKDEKTVRTLLAHLVSNYEIIEQPEIDRASMWLATLNESPLSEDEIDALKETVIRINDGETMKYIGDLYYQRGDMAEAAKWYAPAMRSRNGMLKIDLNEKGFYC